MGPLYAQTTNGSSIPSTSVASEPAQTKSTDVIHLPYAQFQIPFSFDRSGALPASVSLYVSTDGGGTWQYHGKANPDAGHFEFRAAAEGEYLFTVQTIDAAGVGFPSLNPPMRVRVDTSRPEATLRADLDDAGNLIVDLCVEDQFLDAKSAMLRVRTDRESQWREIPVENLSLVSDHFEGQVELILPPCREVLMIFSVQDTAKNNTEVSHRFTMPRTAAGSTDLQLASTRSGPNVSASNGSSAGAPNANMLGVNAPNVSAAGVPSIPGAVVWEPETQTGNFPTTPIQPNLATLASTSEEIARPQPETLPEPAGIGSVQDQSLALSKAEFNAADPSAANIQLQGSSDPSQFSPKTLKQPAQSNSNEPEVDAQNPYFCKTRTFSLDYSVDSLGGDALSQVELWGTEDNGLTWQKWGTDPDRVSPFDVKVGNDGLFGFRMVVVGQGGYVLGQPKPGERADFWIHIDTETPSCKITRAVYGEGSEAGMLVIDYSCIDAQLADQPITLSYSQTPDSAWTTFASGIRNAGLYLWKVEPNVPNRVYLKMEVVDKAGNIGQHRLDLPIDIKGLSPRGRIQGFRPIFE